jgi:hypothetical protein
MWGMCLEHLLLLLGLTRPSIRPSAIRKLQESVSDLTYSSRRISRKQLVDSDRDADQSRDSSSDSEDHPDHPDESSSEDKEQGNSVPRSQSPALTPTADDDLASKIRKTREEEQLKGIAVSRQIVRIDLIPSRDLCNSLSLPYRVTVSVDSMGYTTRRSYSSAERVIRCKQVTPSC